MAAAQFYLTAKKIPADLSFKIRKHFKQQLLSRRAMDECEILHAHAHARTPARSGMRAGLISCRICRCRSRWNCQHSSSMGSASERYNRWCNNPIVSCSNATRWKGAPFVRHSSAGRQAHSAAQVPPALPAAGCRLPVVALCVICCTASVACCMPSIASRPLPVVWGCQASQAAHLRRPEIGFSPDGVPGGRAGRSACTRSVTAVLICNGCPHL